MARSCTEIQQNRNNNMEQITITIDSKELANAAKKVSRCARKLRKAVEEMDKISATIKMDVL